VAAEAQGRGVGRALVSFILQAAREADITHVCALTLRPHFFEAIGFQVIDRWEISPKIWQECIYCSKFHHCDEIAVFLDLEETAAASPHAPHRDQLVSLAVPVAWRRDFAMAMGK
jgi:amino-acid N-acetyltransferase